MKRIVILTLATSLVALSLTSCDSKTKSTSTAVAAPVQSSVLTKVAPVEQAEVAETVNFTTTLLPFKKTFVTPQMSLRINEILVEVGDHVKKDQLVATLDNNQFNQSAVQLKNAEQNLARMKSVFEAGGVSRSQIDELETSVTVLRETVANLERNIELRSPIDGIVTGRYNEAGDLFAMAGNADGGMGVLQVMQIDKLKAVVAISEKYYPQVYKGMKVEVTADVYPDKVFEGEVNIVYPSINSSTHTFNVEVIVPNAKEILRPGMFARTQFNMGNRLSLTVPDVAVQKQMGVADRYVYVIKDGVAERRVVTVGRQVGTRVELLSGVEAGEEVAITALSKIKNGTSVEVVR
ncbi:MAG: efflux RND transporter periplasmic adaptor subunit [Tidjanibacter sp.]|nr:efflux RND transporter periplasmic adaptor subunit [Tidjanibacter sp.]